MHYQYSTTLIHICRQGEKFSIQSTTDMKLGTSCRWVGTQTGASVTTSDTSYLSQVSCQLQARLRSFHLALMCIYIYIYILYIYIFFIFYFFFFFFFSMKVITTCVSPSGDMLQDKRLIFFGTVDESCKQVLSEIEIAYTKYLF